MKHKHDKKAHASATRIINKKRSYGSLKLLAKPRGLKFGSQTQLLGEAMLEQNMMANDALRILICNAYRIGFKAGRAMQSQKRREHPSVQRFGAK